MTEGRLVWIASSTNRVAASRWFRIISLCHLYRHRGHYLVCNGTVFVLADLQVVWYPKDLLREDVHNVRYNRFRDPIGGADCGSGVRNRVFTIIEFDSSVDERRDIKIYIATGSFCLAPCRVVGEPWGDVAM